MIGRVKGGHGVARLKGGDPFVCGRGSEEVEALRAQGIEVEVIPGITAGIAVPAALGIPVTDRRVTHGVTFISGHGADPHWEGPVPPGTTPVIFKGLGHFEKNLLSLRTAGKKPPTPPLPLDKG